jgi:hypothetical protein
MTEWFTTLIDWVLSEWRAFPFNDALNVVVSSCALLIALASFAYAIRARRRDATAAARNDLNSCLSELSKLRTQREEKERELGEKFYAAENVPIRASLNDRTKLYLSKAVLLSTRYRKLDLTSFDNLLLGAALADEGKYHPSLRFYRHAVKTSADSVDKATALRVYGRALIAAGRPRGGRWRMRKAAKLFAVLGRKRGYDRDKMNCESADTYARLVQTQMRWNYRGKTRSDLIDFNRSISQIKDRGRRDFLEDVFVGITGSQRAPAKRPPIGPPAPSPAPALSAAAANAASEAESEVIAQSSPADEALQQSSPPLVAEELRTG